MSRRKTIIGDHGDRSVRVTNGLAVAFEDLLQGVEDSVAAVVERSMNEQLREVKAAWPKPPTKIVYRDVPQEVFMHNGKVVVMPAHTKKIKLKRTGRSLAGFKYERKVRGDDLIFQINNRAKDDSGETYTWYVKTYDLNMDGRKGKLTRAWHHFRRRALRIIEKRVLQSYSKRLPREL